MDVYDKGLITVLVCCAVFCLVSIPLLLRKVPRNPVYGYRTRATLSDDHIWYEANAYFAGRFIIASVLSACAALILYDWRGLTPDAFMKASIALLVAPALVAWPLTVWFVHDMVSRSKFTSEHR
jgi:uncharacterized membrane protein